ncbi:MAG TPA: hypothetical protein DCG75_17260 [Bacteroidales bacterium]|nr:hypothetical protein [Bacteroidales bacterium]
MNLKTIFFLLIFFQLIYLKGIAQINSKEITEKNIDDYLEYFSGEYPGAIITVIQEGNTLFNKAYGLSNIQDSIKMTSDKLFNLAGLSKTFTAFAILKLVENKKLNLDDNIADIFKGFPEYGRKVKIINLLNHTSGLKSYDPQKVILNDDILNYLSQEDSLLYKPGSKWKYSNSDYTLLVKIIEKKSRKSYKKFLEKYLFKDNLMNNTFLSEDFSQIKNLADAHFKIDTKYEVIRKQSLIYGEQGIYTNSEDYAKWDNVLFNNDSENKSLVKKIFEINTLNNGDVIPNAGLGWSIMEKNGIPYYWQGGSFEGYTNFVLHLPNSKITILILTNRNDSYDLLRLSIMIAKLYDKQLLIKFG